MPSAVPRIQGRPTTASATARAHLTGHHRQDQRGDQPHQRHHHDHRQHHRRPCERDRQRRGHQQPRPRARPRPPAPAARSGRAPRRPAARASPAATASAWWARRPPAACPAPPSRWPHASRSGGPPTAAGRGGAGGWRSCQARDRGGQPPGDDPCRLLHARCLRGQGPPAPGRRCIGHRSMSSQVPWAGRGAGCLVWRSVRSRIRRRVQRRPNRCADRRGQGWGRRKPKRSSISPSTVIRWSTARRCWPRSAGPGTVALRSRRWCRAASRRSPRPAARSRSGTRGGVDQAASQEAAPGRDPHSLYVGSSAPYLTRWRDLLQAAATAAEQEQHQQHDDDDQQQGTEPHLASLRVERRLPVRDAG
jgi:hypothetical protein